jgi:transketolase
MSDSEALQTLIEAAETLKGEGIADRVVNCYYVKPIGAATLRAAARATGRIVVTDDHWPDGGLEDVVLGAFADSKESPRVLKLAVGEMASSGKPEELLASAGIDATGIAEAAGGWSEARPAPRRAPRA